MAGDRTVRAIVQGTPAVDEEDVDVITVCRFLALQALEKLTAPGRSPWTRFRHPPPCPSSCLRAPPSARTCPPDHVTDCMTV